MTVATGTRLGPYEVVALIGAGGMGEVYRAHDTLLNRDVALKVLPEAFSRDTQRMARFEREAKLLASLNHPNIAAIYGLEVSGPIRALVMELVEGPNLAERIRSGPVPFDEALPIARQVADAVEYAHDNNVIHRDLKPANIKVKADGMVKVLDFGLAKAVSDEPTEADMSNSPTLSMAATRQGVILGTAAYMSPEQAKGRTVDRRADVWAFGCVLYEMLTSRQAFHGEDVTEVLAAVVRADPDWNQLPAKTPPALRNLLRRSLEKNLRRRLGHISEARILLEDVLSGAVPAEQATAQRSGALGNARVAWSVAAAILLAALAVGAFVFLRRVPEPPQQAVRFAIGAPERATLSNVANFLVVSPDGSKIVFIAADASGKPQLWIRTLDSEGAQPLPGTGGAAQPFWSADNRFLAFFAEGRLKKIAVTGGPAQTLSARTEALTTVYGGTWSREGVILVAAGSATGATIYRVSGAGGAATRVTTLDSSRQELGHRFPYFLPDGRHFLYLALSSNPENNAIYAASLDSSERKLVMSSFSNPVYTPPGYLLFNREGTLMAQPFDADRLEPAGEAVPIAEDVQYTAATGRAAFAASENGVLAYRMGSAAATSRLVWVDRTGKELGQVGEPNEYRGTVLSPDEKRIIVDHYDAQRNRDLWLYDLLRGTSSRFTFDPANESDPVWSPDGNNVVFTSTRDNTWGLYRKPASGVGQEEALVKGSTIRYARDWSSDGRFIVYQTADPKTGNDVWVLPLEGDRKPSPFVQTQFNETNGRFSPNMRWIAYQSNESGTLQVYVQSFPTSVGKWQVSTNGGGVARWRRDGKELFYIALDGKFMVVPVSGDGTFQAGTPRPLFQTIFAGLPTGGFQYYDLTADGQRFVFNTNLQQAQAPITVVLNWQAGLKK